MWAPERGLSGWLGVFPGLPRRCGPICFRPHGCVLLHVHITSGHTTRASCPLCTVPVSVALCPSLWPRRQPKLPLVTARNAGSNPATSLRPQTCPRPRLRFRAARTSRGTSLLKRSAAASAQIAARGSSGSPSSRTGRRLHLGHSTAQLVSSSSATSSWPARATTTPSQTDCLRTSTEAPESHLRLPRVWLTLNRTCDSARRPGLISFWPGRRPLTHAG